MTFSPIFLQMIIIIILPYDTLVYWYLLLAYILFGKGDSTEKDMEMSQNLPPFCTVLSLLYGQYYIELYGLYNDLALLKYE